MSAIPIFLIATIVAFGYIQSNGQLKDISTDIDQKFSMDEKIFGDFKHRFKRAHGKSDLPSTSARKKKAKDEENTDKGSRRSRPPRPTSSTKSKSSQPQNKPKGVNPNPNQTGDPPGAIKGRLVIGKPPTPYAKRSIRLLATDGIGKSAKVIAKMPATTDSNGFYEFMYSGPAGIFTLQYDKQKDGMKTVWGKRRKFEYRRIVWAGTHPTFPETNVDIDYPILDVTYEPYMYELGELKEDPESPEIKPEEHKKKERSKPEELPDFAVAQLSAMCEDAKIKQEQLGPIKGKLVKGNKPYARENIELETPDEKTMAGKTDDQGRYTFLYNGSAGIFILRYGGKEREFLYGRMVSAHVFPTFPVTNVDIDYSGDTDVTYTKEKDPYESR